MNGYSKYISSILISVVLILAVSFVMSGCSTSDSSEIGSSNTSSIATQGTTTEVGTEKASDTTTSAANTAQESTISGTSSEEVTEIPYISLISDNRDAYFLRLGEKYMLEIPVAIANRLVTVEELNKQVSEYIDERTDVDIVTPELWNEAMQNKGYFAVYPDCGYMTSSDILLQVSIYPSNDTVPSLFEEMRNSTDGTVINSVFGGLISSLMYQATGFTALTPVGDTSNDSEDILAYIFLADADNLSFTSGYFGYFVIAYDKAAEQYVVLLVAGLNDITAPEDVQEIYSGFDYAKSDVDYWFSFEPITE